jgi:hypothetical protein
MKRVNDQLKAQGLALIAEWSRLQFPTATAVNIRIVHSNHMITVESDSPNATQTLDGKFVMHCENEFSA